MISVPCHYASTELVFADQHICHQYTKFVEQLNLTSFICRERMGPGLGIFWVFSNFPNFPDA
jgi:hypothetical protein